MLKILRLLFIPGRSIFALELTSLCCHGIHNSRKNLQRFLVDCFDRDYRVSLLGNLRNRLGDDLSTVLPLQRSGFSVSTTLRIFPAYPSARGILSTRSPFNITSSAAPSSASIAVHNVAAPNAPRTRNINLVDRESTMFCMIIE